MERFLLLFILEGGEMKIGIISDTHDDLHHLETVLDVLRVEKVTKILHCGDVCGPDVIRAPFAAHALLIGYIKHHAVKVNSKIMFNNK